MHSCEGFDSPARGAQVFGFINVQLFNQLLLRRECCSFNNGEYVKTGLAELENWIHKAGEAWVGQSLEELRYIRQVLPCAFSLSLASGHLAPTLCSLRSCLCGCCSHAARCLTELGISGSC